MLARLLTAPAIFAVLLTPAVDHSPGPVPRPPLKVPEITITAADYSFTGPASVAAGPTAFRLVNHGREVHHLTIFRLPGDMTLDQLHENLMKHPGPPPDMSLLEGGPNAVNPGSSATTIVNLQPGRYALLCFVPAADGTPHFMKGMMSELTVTPEPKATPVALPTPDITVHLADFSFTFSRPITAGQHAVLVHDGGTQWHELVLFRLDPGKNAADFVKWAMDGMETAPPGTFAGGVSPLGPGGQNTALLDFHRGKYLAVCFLEDPKDGKPHFMHGMIQEITVQ